MGITAEAINLYKEVTSKVTDRNALKSLRTRARNTPSMIMTSGLTQTLTFLLSKSSKENYKYLSGTTKEKPKEDEKTGYSAYLYIIMKLLTKQGIIMKEPSTLEEVIDVIKWLDENPDKASIAQNVLMEFLLEFKKIAEALIEE